MAEINWLDHWRPIEFVSEPENDAKIQDLKKKVRLYVRGWLAEYDAENGTSHVVKKFKFEKRSHGNEIPLKYDVYAYIFPDPTENGHNGHTEGGETGEEPGGEHLTPPPPPPPGKVD
jgi:hypothetical protein